MTNWAGLGGHLAIVGQVSRFTWPELEAIVGRLPPSAANHRAWWLGDRPHVRSWTESGLALDSVRLGESVTFVRLSEGVPRPPRAGDSAVQRRVEPIMLRLLGERQGVELAPRRLTSPSGAVIDVDGVAADGSVLAECWAHQGPAKVAQKYKLVNDAAKLRWAASWWKPHPVRLVLCVSDEAAVKHLRGRSWQGQAIQDMGVGIEVVRLEDDDVRLVLEAQKAQFR